MFTVLSELLLDHKFEYLLAYIYTACLYSLHNFSIQIDLI